LSEEQKENLGSLKKQLSFGDDERESEISYLGSQFNPQMRPSLRGSARQSKMKDVNLNNRF
jgi:hypothetical protein